MKKLLFIVVGTLFLFSAQTMTSESCSAQSKRSTKSSKSTQPAQSSQATQKSHENDGWIEVGEVTLENHYYDNRLPDIQATLYVREMSGSVLFRVYCNDKYYMASPKDNNECRVIVEGDIYTFDSPLRKERDSKQQGKGYGVSISNPFF